MNKYFERRPVFEKRPHCKEQRRQLDLLVFALHACVFGSKHKWLKQGYSSGCFIFLMVSSENRSTVSLRNGHFLRASLLPLCSLIERALIVALAFLTGDCIQLHLCFIIRRAITPTYNWHSLCVCSHTVNKCGSDTTVAQLTVRLRACRAGPCAFICDVPTIWP